MNLSRSTAVRLAVAVLAVGATVPLAALPAQAASAGQAAPVTAAVLPAAVPFTAAAVTLNADGSHTVAWASPATAVTVTAVASADADAATGTVVGQGAGTGTLTVPAGALAAGTRWFFRLTPDSGAALTVADRSLHLADATNFRDAGGYRTTDGHWVRMGRVYRSGKLSGLTPAEQQQLTAAGITRDVDLRNASERGSAPDAIPAGLAYQVADVTSLAHGIGFHGNAVTTLLGALAAGLFNGSSDLGQSIGYPFMVDFTGSDRAFHDTLTAIEAEQGALVYHCTAGKDRTGWATAVLLTLLGVDRATVNADFLASNTYTGRPDAVELSWLDAAFAEVNHVYGSFDAYLHQGLNLTDADIAALRARLLV
ncbi:tyrosine-protein phosphatase [Kitasatospora sp. NPDC090308]|uniref:tyrosine-protein phosphatase n=1 Tax=Kitasatospora sp. NPDC090308 TaxID=3364082 RepID=UPI00381075A9